MSWWSKNHPKIEQHHYQNIYDAAEKEIRAIYYAKIIELEEKLWKLESINKELECYKLIYNNLKINITIQDETK